MGKSLVVSGLRDDADSRWFCPCVAVRMLAIADGTAAGLVIH